MSKNVTDKNYALKLSLVFSYFIFVIDEYLLNIFIKIQSNPKLNPFTAANN